ncbi:MAG: aldehyde-activating protein, partial [Moraxellaceae bacterium]
MRKYLGCCLCGAVQYSFLGANLLAYECHCSVCQKVSGSAFSATVLCAEDSFQWLKGSELIKSYSRDNGYKTHFCTQCGNQVPNQFRNYPLMSVPLGSINDSVDILVAVKLHLASTPKN